MVYKQTQGKLETLQSLQAKLSVKCPSQSEVDFHPDDSTSRSIVKARGQDNIFKALEVQTGYEPRNISLS